MSQTSYKEWLETSIHRGSIYCCPEDGIELDPLHIGRGAFGVVYKATIKQKTGIGSIVKTILGIKSDVFSDTTVAVKILFPDEHGDYKEDLYQQFVKEVAYFHPLCLFAFHFVYRLICSMNAKYLAKTSQGSKQPP